MQFIRRFLSRAPQQAQSLSRRLCTEDTYNGKEPTSQPIRRERCLNRVDLIGRLGRDPDVRGTPEKPYVFLTLATTRTYNTPDGEPRSNTEWHRISVFKPSLANYVSSYLSKGDRLYLNGRLTYGEYTNPETNQVNKVSSVRADEIFKLSSSKANMGQNNDVEDDG